jgi:hypothetical protein
MRVYLTAPSGSGKTTIAEHIASKYGLRKLPSAARQVFAGFGYASFEALMARPEAYAEFQNQVAARQCSLEEEFGDNFVSDRCVDHFAFRALYGTGSHRAYQNDQAQRYLHGLRKRSEAGTSLVFLVRPSRVVNAAALADPQGREAYLDWESVNRMAGAIQFILESNGIVYYWIDTDDRLDREKFVGAQIDAAIGLPGAV